MARIVVGLSGGVDSSVAALLLKEQGHEVIGMFMKNWHDGSFTDQSDCPWWEDSTDALEVAELLGIPYHTIDLSSAYKERIVDYMFREYEMGRTPNPDVLCNREIKFDLFLDAALKLKADFVATGHYCKKETIEGEDGQIHRLLAGKDRNKDQSYFLCQLSQEQLAKAIFPLGELKKPDVRRIAEEKGLPTARKKDSQGLCFIGKVSLPEFLQQELEPKQGKVLEVPADSSLFEKEELVPHPPSLEELRILASPFGYSGTKDAKVVGEHQGAHFFTVGQRKGLGIGGTEEPLFVIGRDVDSNTVYAGQGQDHPGLYRKGLFIRKEEVHWIREDLALTAGESGSYSVRIRYRQPLQNAELFMVEEGLYIIFEEPQRGIAAGQFAAWYSGEELLGSGVIAE